MEFFLCLVLGLDEDERIRIEAYFQCHGGITYTGGGEHSDYPIESDLWWFGFDCGHAGDRPDYEYAIKQFPKRRDELERILDIQNQRHYDGDVIRTEEYVADECKNLAEQLKEFEESEEK